MSTTSGTAAEALRDFARSGHRVIGFAYRPSAAPWFLCTGGEPTDSAGRPVLLDDVFELRAFDGERELRWRNESGGHGPGVTVGDDIPGYALGQFYDRILWGVTRGHTSAGDDWVRLFDARIGRLDVPLAGPVEDGQLVRLTAVEYHREDEHGNLSVVDERLVGLYATTAPGKRAVQDVPAPATPEDDQ